MDPVIQFIIGVFFMALGIIGLHPRLKLRKKKPGDEFLLTIEQQQLRLRFLGILFLIAGIVSIVRSLL